MSANVLDIPGQLEPMRRVRDDRENALAFYVYTLHAASPIWSVPPSISIVSYYYAKVKVNKQVSKCDTK